MAAPTVSSPVQSLIDRTCEGSDSARAAAAEALADLCERDPTAPFEVVLGFLSSRMTNSGEYRETALEVRNTLVAVRYRVARARVAVHGLTVPAPADLNACSDSDLIEQVRARMWESVTMFSGVGVLHEGLASASPGQEAIFALTWADVEMLLGGVSQLLHSSTGILWPEAVMGAQLIGASNAADILIAAGTALPDGPPARDENKRRAQCDALPEGALDELDRRCEAEGVEDELRHCMAAYIRAHPDEFFH